jgi:hypothetical protein
MDTLSSQKFDHSGVHFILLLPTHESESVVVFVVIVCQSSAKLYMYTGAEAVSGECQCSVTDLVVLLCTGMVGETSKGHAAPPIWRRVRAPLTPG